jgi:hypothetical protein
MSSFGRRQYLEKYPETNRITMGLFIGLSQTWVIKPNIQQFPPYEIPTIPIHLMK